MTPDEILFRKKRPPINGDKALSLAEEHGVIVSCTAREAPQGLLLAAFVSERDTTVGPLILNSVVARELCERLINLGYGPQLYDR
jgi:predicted GNAT superfamily acetyltransferase